MRLNETVVFLQASTRNRKEKNDNRDCHIGIVSQKDDREKENDNEETIKEHAVC